MLYTTPVPEIIRKRFSCRSYLDSPIAEEKRQALEELMSAIRTGPLGTPARFKLVAATEQDRNVLRGLGTYGFIRGATGFVLGAVTESAKNLEDFGYLMEQIVLLATDLDLGTCWLGGSFTKSSFADKMAIRDGELLPAVVAVGHMPDQPGMRDRLVRRGAGSVRRLPWERLFFDRQFDVPISAEAAGAYAEPLEMVRLGPSASNKQPWRIVKDGASWHLYLQRTKGYGKGLSGRFMASDLQRIDMGIAMSHWELTARELGLAGEWAIQEPGIKRPDDLTQYVVSWVAGP
jgi:nitroreductase